VPAPAAELTKSDKELLVFDDQVDWIFIDDEFVAL
jgi:hypothetical protein